MRQRTDCSSTTGLVGPWRGVARVRGRTQIRTAQPGSIRCTGLGAIAAAVGLVEFTGCRSDLSMHLRAHVRHGTRKRVTGLGGLKFEVRHRPTCKVSAKWERTTRT